MVSLDRCHSMTPSNPYCDMVHASQASCYGEYAPTCHCPLDKSCQRYGAFTPVRRQVTAPAPQATPEKGKVAQGSTIRAVSKGVCYVCQKPYQVGDMVVFVPQAGPKHRGC